MRGDFSRIRRARARAIPSVLEQQGRVALDADANEQRFIDERLRRTETTDVIGEFGGPGTRASRSRSSDGNQILIGPGRYYVAGLRGREPGPGVLRRPAGLPPVRGDSAAALLGMLPGTPMYLAVVLQVWQRLVTALDDSCLRDPALGQADTTVREQTLWRVLARPVPADATAPRGRSARSCTGTSPRRAPGRSASARVPAGQPAGAGRWRPPATRAWRTSSTGSRSTLRAISSSAAFKWSRENGSVVLAVRVRRPRLGRQRIDRAGLVAVAGSEPGLPGRAVGGAGRRHPRVRRPAGRPRHLVPGPGHRQGHAHDDVRGAGVGRLQPQRPGPPVGPGRSGRRPGWGTAGGGHPGAWWRHAIRAGERDPGDVRPRDIPRGGLLDVPRADGDRDRGVAAVRQRRQCRPAAVLDRGSRGTAGVRLRALGRSRDVAGDVGRT